MPSAGRPASADMRSANVRSADMHSVDGRSAGARFADLRSAGRELAGALDAWAGQPDTLVLGVVRGGVPAAAEVATSLRLPLDVLLLRRLLIGADPANAAGVTVVDASGRVTPGSSDHPRPLCAAWAAGNLVIDSGAAPLDATTPEIASFLRDALQDFAQRNALCRSDPPRQLASQTILLVDNGVHTGGTARAAVRALRALRAARIVVAVPVLNAATRDDLVAVADDVVWLAAPEPFGHVGMCYNAFDVPALEGIREIVRKAASD